MLHFRAAAATAVCLVATIALSGCDSGPHEGEWGGRILFRNNCATCHGSNGEGQQDIAAPAIAGLHQDYVMLQLTHFREGRRGHDFDDPAGLRMLPMAQTLKGEGEVEAVATYIASMPRARIEKTVQGGDRTRGAELYQKCAACHGAKGEGVPSLGPPVNGASDWYLLKQLERFRSGKRGTDPTDVKGMLMRPYAVELPDDEAMKDVVAHIQTLYR